MPFKNKEDKVEIPIDFLATKEIDMNPQVKKRTVRDEYDYNDDFIDSFEGDDQFIDAECNLENFFVYKGTMTTNPKNIMRKFSQKEKLKQENNFEFENDAPKAKRDPKFHNIVYYLIYKEYTETDKGNRRKLMEYVLRNRNAIPLASKKQEENPEGENIVEIDNKTEEPKECVLGTLLDNETFDVVDVYGAYREELEAKINAEAEEIKAILKDAKNYTNSFKSFNFKEAGLLPKFREFLVDYTLFYYTQTDDMVQGRSFTIFARFFYPECTNYSKLKYFVTSEVDKKETEFDAKEICNGKFVRVELEKTELK